MTTVETCRFCLEPAPREDLVSPCACDGSQKYVHLSCLRLWQQTVRDQPRAARCNVCLRPFSFAPDSEPMLEHIHRLAREVLPTFLALVGVLALNHSLLFVGCITLIALLCTRTFAFAVIAIVGIFSLLVCYQIRGARPILFVDESGRTRMALIRQGEPVQGLSAGTLLVASEAISHGAFRHSVVLLLEHDSARGSRGIIINSLHVSPVADEELLRDDLGVTLAGMIHEGGENWPGYESTGLSRSIGAPAYDGGGFAGGLPASSVRSHPLDQPVSFQTENTSTDTITSSLLHSVSPPPSCPCSSPDDPSSIHSLKFFPRYGGPIPCRVILHQFEGILGATSLSLSHITHPLLVDGDMGQLISRMKCTSMEEIVASRKIRPQLFQGCAMWAPGQLDGEVRLGLWGWQAAHVSMVDARDRRLLWEELRNSRDLRMFREENTNNPVFFPNM